MEESRVSVYAAVRGILPLCRCAANPAATPAATKSEIEGDECPTDSFASYRAERLSVTLSSIQPRVNQTHLVDCLSSLFL